MGRWTLAALFINSIIGSGIYGVPSEIIRLVGAAAPFASLLAALGIGVVVACFAEVGSRYSEAGGLYLYARDAFGRFAGIQMGWLALLVRVSAHAAIASLLVTYLGEFAPGVTAPLPRAALLVATLGGLAAINIRGVGGGARVSNLFTAAKLVPLFAFVAVGLAVTGGRLPMPVGAGGGSAEWTQAVLLLLFAYGGFEAALLPMGEARDPRRDVPFALGTALLVCAVIYTATLLVVAAVLPGAASSPRPLADAARAMVGPWGASCMAAGATVSILGILSAGMLNTPRLIYAFARGGDLPAPFGAVHPRLRTPYVALAAYAGTVCLLAIGGSFVWNAVLSAVGRLFTYGLVCAALLRFRRIDGGGAFRMPGGSLCAVAGLAFTGFLATRTGRDELIVVAATMALALVNWAWVRYGRRAPPDS